MVKRNVISREAWQALLTGFEQSAEQIIFYCSEESIWPEKKVTPKNAR